MIEVFPQEKVDGLEGLIANASIAYTLSINHLKDEILAQTAKWSATAALTQPDLFYMDSILATLGWNLNDDIFLKDEVIAAKNTPVDKPFNMMHEQENIIGHMTASRLLNTNYEVVGDEDFEHIAVSSVIYRAWRDEKKKEEIEKTIAEILDGKWKVSMECLFDKFDYGLITPAGKQVIIPRTPETSYLTKYLRAYKGTGIVNGNKIGRVLRNITFCGKGLVDDPGNPFSIIFNNNKKFFGAKASNIKEFVMNELEMAKAEIDKARTELESAKAEIQKVAEAKWQAAIAERDSEIFTKIATIKEKSEAIASLQEDVKKMSETLATSKASLEQVEIVKAEAIKGFEAAKAELDKIKAETTLATRKAALSAVIKDAERVESLLVKFSGASEEMFKELITTLAGMPPWLKDKEGDKDEDEKKKKAEADKMEEECKKKAEAQIVADLAKAELDKDIPGHSTAKKTDNDMKSIVDFMTANAKNKPL